MRTGCIKSLFFLLSFGYACAQPQPYVFQWEGMPHGLTFEGTNLSVSAKASIRDDIQQVYGQIPISNRTVRIYRPEDKEYGTYAGHLYLADNRLSYTDISGWKYTTLNGMTNVHLSGNVCAKYLEKIALTNQHAAAVGKLTDLLSMMAAASTGTVSMAAYADRFWSLEKNRAVTGGDLADSEYRDDYTEGIQEWREWPAEPPVSILGYETGEINGTQCLSLELKFSQPEAGEVMFHPVFFINGKWRFIIR